MLNIGDVVVGNSSGFYHREGKYGVVVSKESNFGYMIKWDAGPTTYALDTEVDPVLKGVDKGQELEYHENQYGNHLEEWGVVLNPHTGEGYETVCISVGLD